MLYYFDSNNPKAPAQIGHILTNMVNDIILPNQEIIILCIGSDRSTGDSLGPVIGHKFKDFISPGLYLLGDLNQPVHAATSTSQELLILPTTWSHPHFRQPVCPLYSR